MVIAESAYDQWRKLNDEETDEVTEQEQFKQQATQKTTKKYDQIIIFKIDVNQ